MSQAEENPNSIDAWKTRLRKSAGEAADYFLAARNAVPADIRARVFAAEPDDDEIRAAFAYARENFSRPLSGVPYFLKDNYDVKGLPTGAGSAFLGKTRPVPVKDSRLYETLHTLGAVFVGKTQMNEFASGLSGENPHYGDCPNPHDYERLSGGSSSGSAFAVGAGLAPFAFGTDTAGSVRVPAAFCGVFGLRIQPGPLAREGVVPWAPSFDSAGWFADNARDMATLCAELGYGTPAEARTPRPALWCGSLFDIPEKALRANYRFVADCIGAQTDRDACALLEPLFREALTAFDVLRDVETYRTQKPLLERHGDLFSEPLRARLEQAGRRTAAEIERAQRISTELGSALHEVFTAYDALVWPITPCIAPKIGAYAPSTRTALLKMNVVPSLARLPSLAIPVPGEDGMSGGLQCVFPSEMRMDVPSLLARSGYLN